MWGNKPTVVRSTSRFATDSSPAGESEKGVGLIPVAAQGGSIRSLGAEPTAWTAAGDASLAVEGGTLTVRGNGELAPTIRTAQPVRDVDLRRHTSLTATVRPDELVGTDAAVQFRFKLVHDAGRSSQRTRRARNAGGSQVSDDSLPSLTSETFSAPQGEPLRLHWDLDGVDDRVLGAARRLEIVCERADRPAKRGPYGQGATGFRGSVTVADVVLSDSPDSLAAARLQNHWKHLELARGSYEGTVVETKTGDAEAGVFEFAEGEAAYDFHIREDGTHVFELDGHAYRFQDGMAAVERQ